MATTQLSDIRQQLLDRVWLGVLVLALVGTPASASRAFSTGWLPLYSFHVGLAAIIVALFLLRRRLSFAVRSMALLVIFFLIGSIGILTLGLLGAGLWWLVMCSLLASTLHSQRVGLLVSAVSLLVLGIAAIGFTTGRLTVPVNPGSYVYDATAWVSFLMAASLMPFMVFQSITLFQRSTADLLEKVERQRVEIERLATHDPLTGLPRWELAESHFRMAAAAARRSGRMVAFLFIDLDGFKAINDAHGHEAGDRVLQTFAARLSELLRAEDTAARIGGDEFAVILGSVGGADEALQVASRLNAAVAVPITIGSGDVAVGASIGIALLPNHGTDVASLRRRADQAMYAAKASGWNQAAIAA